jgi:uncharacterized protein YjbI with pentapeptide repeats
MFFPFRILHIAALLVAAATAGNALGANSKDVARVKKRGQITECLKCDLSGADFRNGFFQLAVLIEANLSGAKFDGANMAGTQLNNANLSKGTFTYTNFSGAQLQGADMRNADFTRAWFNWAWLNGAKLDGADFTGAHMIGAQLQGADMRKVIGLTQGQLRYACGDATTLLPAGIETPRCPY